MNLTSNPRELKDKIVDIAVVGGGINGAGIVRDAALRNLDVVLLEKDDFASGTSSCSTKFAMEGLRYLEQFEFGLVFEALKERKILMDIASHLVSPRKFLFPVYDQSHVSGWELKLELTLYDSLSIFRNIGRHKFLDLDQVRELHPEITTENFNTAALYYDCQMDDFRIALENIMDAAKMGAQVLNYCEVKDISPTPSGTYWELTAYDRLKRETVRFVARKIVNTTGPWSDFLARNWRTKDQKCLHTSKGVHIVLPSLDTNVAGFFPSIFDDRLFFAMPWEGKTLVGTTDTEFNQNPDKVNITRDDRNYLLTNLNRYLEDRYFTENDVFAEFAGVQSLPDPSNSALSESDLSRRHQIVNERESIYSVIGGKYTTYRAIASETLTKLDAPGTTTTQKRCLPGGWLNDDQKSVYRSKVSAQYSLNKKQIDELVNRYGRRCLDVLEMESIFEDALQGVGQNSVPIRAQVYYAVLEEGARKPQDVIRRRTNLFLRDNDYKYEVQYLMKKVQDVTKNDTKLKHVTG